MKRNFFLLEGIGEGVAEIVIVMRGEKATIPDIELEELVLPSSLLSDESLSPDETPEEVELSHYRIDSVCVNCTANMRLCVRASVTAIRLFHQLLLLDLHLLCPGCSRNSRNGRT